MRIAVLADTHASQLGQLPAKLVHLLSTVDMIIHAGDFTEVQVLNELKQVKRVKAVRGNMDSAELRTTLPGKEVLEIGNTRIGITHGSGSPWGIEERVREVFEGDQVDVIAYGHSHRAQNEVIHGILFFNPGRGADSFGILTIDEGIRGEIVQCGE